MPGGLDKDLYSLAEVARILSISEPEVRALVKAKELPQPHLLPGTKRVRCWLRFQIEAYLYKVRCSSPTRANSPTKQRRQSNRESSMQANWIALVPKQMESVRADLVEECRCPAVYFLMKSGQIIYVGSSVDPMRRSQEHASGNAKTVAKDFDFALFLPVTLEELIETERTFIALLDPPLNQNMKPKKQLPPWAISGDDEKANLP